MQGNAAFASFPSPVRNPSERSASISCCSECGAGNFWNSSAGSKGMRLSWHRLPTVHAKSDSAISALSRMAMRSPLRRRIGQPRALAIVQTV